MEDDKKQENTFNGKVRIAMDHEDDEQVEIEVIETVEKKTRYCPKKIKEQIEYFDESIANFTKQRDLLVQQYNTAMSYAKNRDKTRLNKKDAKKSE